MSTTNTLDLNNRIDALEKKHDAGGSATDTTFDNTGTDLSATDVQAAILEVNTKTNTALTNQRNTNKDITTELDNLLQAIYEGNPGKYGYAIGDYFVGPGTHRMEYILADLNTFYASFNNGAMVDSPHITLLVNTKQDTAFYANVDPGIGTNDLADTVLQSFLTGEVLEEIKSDMIALFGGETGLEHLIPHGVLYNKISGWDLADWFTQSVYIMPPSTAQLGAGDIFAQDMHQQGEGFKPFELMKNYTLGRLIGNRTAWTRCLFGNTSAVAYYGRNIYDQKTFTDTARALGVILLKGEVATRTTTRKSEK